MAKLINLTEHDINIVDRDKVILTIPPSGRVVRLGVKIKPIDTKFVNDAVVRITQNEYLGSGFSEQPQNGVYYVVSQLVANSLPEREDLLIPNELVRDKQGKVIGCRSLARVGEKSW